MVETCVITAAGQEGGGAAFLNLWQVSWQPATICCRTTNFLSSQNKSPRRLQSFKNVIWRDFISLFESNKLRGWPRVYTISISIDTHNERRREGLVQKYSRGFPGNRWGGRSPTRICWMRTKSKLAAPRSNRRPISVPVGIDFATKLSFPVDSFWMQQINGLPTPNPLSLDE